MKQLAVLITVLAPAIVPAQDIKTSNFLEHVKSYDFSDLWTLAEFEAGDGEATVVREQPLGYIGENYQRFYIHFISAIQNRKNKYEYFVYGKTRVKENICAFQGTIKITGAATYDQGDLPGLKQGFIEGQYTFFEDPDEKGAGILNGIFRSDFFIDGAGKMKYDAINFVADGFSNNQFKGRWTSYKTGKSKACNWGDYRIPDSDGLDIGAGQFGVDEKYEQYGWLTYGAANGVNKTMTVDEARMKEHEKWWTRD